MKFLKMQSSYLSLIPTSKTTHLKPIHVVQFQSCKTSNYLLLSTHHSLKLKNGDKIDCFYPITNSKPRAMFKWMSSCVQCSLVRWVSLYVSVYLIALGPVANAQGDTPFMNRYPCENVQSYYAGVDHLKGDALSKELNSIIAGHHSLSYKEVWDALKILDAAEIDQPEASSDIIEIYSARAVSKHLAGKLEGWNREHLWPRSYGLTFRPSLTDLHNIRPADVNVNSSRGNKYFGECEQGTTHCVKPANKEAALDTEADVRIWAPPVQVRGDVARALMYMATRYGFPRPPEGPVLRLSDSPSVARREMGLLSTLLKWNELDPPSREERLRNERICRLYQHNRNPFVDHPEYASRIWKRAQGMSSRSTKLPASEQWRLLRSIP